MEGGLSEPGYIRGNKISWKDACHQQSRLTVLTTSGSGYGPSVKSWNSVEFISCSVRACMCCELQTFINN